jgi:hypothetical protein
MLKSPAKHPIAHDRTTAIRPCASSGSSASWPVNTRRVEHRDGAGHLDPIYEAELRGRVRAEARAVDEWAFVRGRSSRDPDAEDAGEEFVMTVTSGVDGGESALAEETEENGGTLGGPFGPDTRGEFA